METYAFLPREAVTAFLMGCPQCSTNNASTCATAADSPLRPLSVVASAIEYTRIDQWSSSMTTTAAVAAATAFACSTPLKREAENVPTSAITTGADKENVVIGDNRDRPPTTVRTAVVKAGNKRKRTVPLKRAALRPDDLVSSSSTLKNSSNSSGATIVWSSSSSLGASPRTDYSGISRSSGSGWWPKWEIRNNNNRSRLSVCGSGGNTADSSGNTQPLDLSSSPVKTTTIRSSSSPSADDFFYKRRRVRRRRAKPKRLNRSCLSRHGDRYEVDDDDDDDNDCSSDALMLNSYRGNGVGDRNGTDNGSGGGDTVDGRRSITDESRHIEYAETDEEDDDPRPAKMKKTIDGNLPNTTAAAATVNNNNDGDYFDKVIVSMVTAVETTTVTIQETSGSTEIQERFSEINELDENQVSRH